MSDFINIILATVMAIVLFAWFADAHRRNVESQQLVREALAVADRWKENYELAMKAAKIGEENSKRCLEVLRGEQ